MFRDERAKNQIWSLILGVWRTASTARMATVQTMDAARKRGRRTPRRHGGARAAAAPTRWERARTQRRALSPPGASRRVRRSRAKGERAFGVPRRRLDPRAARARPTT